MNSRIGSVQRFRRGCNHGRTFDPCFRQFAVPPWLARLLLPLVMTRAAKMKSTEIRSELRRIAVFVADRGDQAHWVEVGRACQRFALQATALD